MASGELRKLFFRATGLVPAGDYWSDLLVNFSEFTNPAIYTWPTAVVMVRDTFTVSATADVRVVATFDVSMGGDSGGIDDFVLE